MIFELSTTRIGLESTVNEVSGEYEVIPRKKCKKCKCYLSKGTVSILCFKCSAAGFGIKLKKGPWNKGKKLHYPVWMKGKKHTEEAKKKMF